jgi:hypothetical protein
MTKTRRAQLITYVLSSIANIEVTIIEQTELAKREFIDD